MTEWPSTKAAKVYRALVRRGWYVAGQGSGSHRHLRHPDYPGTYTWAFHDGEEIGPTMLSRIAKRTGLMPDDL
ncbi:MAG TPA: type II toxin-antitoxin system HicA family toxin [Acidobacteriaceae bacterium]|nr:type II toxin-antitoxin system HicA family toxin [Acidobacteriaceae bacterium]